MTTYALSAGPQVEDTAFGRPRSFLGNRYVYLVLSQRARGLSIGINLSEAKYCSFHCVYCEVNRTGVDPKQKMNIPALVAELQGMLSSVQPDKVRELTGFGHLPSELLQLKEVALSGDGEPTLSPHFGEVVREVIRLRARANIPFFKIVLITNTAGLPLQKVRDALGLLTDQDEIWAKLDAGTQGYMNKVNVTDMRLCSVLSNILVVARERPVVIQSLFPLIGDEEPSENEIEQYTNRLQELKAAGAQISLVQIYSAHRPPHLPDCGHLPLASLSRIARQVRATTGLRAEVF